MVDASAYIEVRGSRYSVPGRLVLQEVMIRITLEDELLVYEGAAQEPAAVHRLAGRGGQQATVADHHKELWEKAMGDSTEVAARALTVYEEMLS
jgi:hypothetical protein